MRERVGLLASLLIGVMGFAQIAKATPPGFDCTKANSALSLAICSSDTLSTLDLSFADAYQALREAVGPQGTTEVFQEAVNFQSTVNASCNLPTDITAFNPSPYLGCIQSLYLKQRAAWVSRLPEPALEETSLAPQDLLAAQTALLNSGYLPAGSQIDGVYGPTTRTAIISFQIAKGLTTTGFLDHQTVAALMSGGNSQTPASDQNTAPEASAPTPQPSVSDADQLAIAKAEAAKAQAEAQQAQAEAAKAQAEAAAQIAITQRQAAAQAAQAAVEAAAKQKAADQAKALQDAQGASP